MRRLAIIFIIFLATAACRTIRESVEIERPVVVHDTIMQASLHTDSLYVRDSVYVEGNTIYKERTYWRSRTQTDTLYVVRTDTITIVRSKTVEVERRLGLFDSIMLKVGKILSTLLVLGLLLYLLFKVRI